MKKFIGLLAVAICVLTSCKEDESSSLNPGTLNLTFENRIAESPLILGETYTNTSNENYRVSELKYIISNITLRRKDGSLFIIPPEESYFVVNQAQASSLTINLDNIDAGAYESVSFGFGVDPTKYPIQSGTLNFIPTAEETGMLWTWSAGYKFIKFEGDFTSNSTQEESPFLIHVGSHGANLDNYREITVPLENTIDEDFMIAEDIQASQHINFDIAQIFDGPNLISLENKSDIQVDPENAPKIASNISTAFSIN